jgi:hypothetical protein
MDNKRLTAFREGKFKQLSADLNKLKGGKQQVKVMNNLLLTEYYRTRCNSPYILLQKLEDLSNS